MRTMKLPLKTREGRGGRLSTPTFCLEIARGSHVSVQQSCRPWGVCAADTISASDHCLHLIVTYDPIQHPHLVTYFVTRHALTLGDPNTFFRRENSIKLDVVVVVVVVVVVAFSSFARILGKCSTIHSLPAL